MTRETTRSRSGGHREANGNGHGHPTTDKPDADTYWPKIATKDELPGWLRLPGWLHDNDYIVGGHPMPTYSYRRSFRLWRSLHMEFMNIWTHALGSAVFVEVTINSGEVIPGGEEKAAATSFWPFVL